MIDLPSYGYTEYTLSFIDAGGPTPAPFGGAVDIVDWPGLRYRVTFTLPMLDATQAREFQSKLERGVRDDVSYPWPLDVKPKPAGAPVVNGASAAGAVLPLRGLVPGYPFYEGQALAVLSGGLGYVHKVASAVTAGDDGTVTLDVWPWTRAGFLDGDVVEVEAPRIRGMLEWTDAKQGAFGYRPFNFSISERV